MDDKGVVQNYTDFDHRAAPLALQVALLGATPATHLSISSAGQFAMLDHEIDDKF